MIELVQLRGRDDSGKRHVFAVDSVYLVDGDSRERIGTLGRSKGAIFKPCVPLADEEAKAIAEDINAAREKQGLFGPIGGVSGFPWTQAVREAYADLIEGEED